MYGAIIGDLAGSIYEYEQLNHIKEIKVDKIIADNSFYSDDTILTIAVLDAIQNDLDYGKYLRQYIKKYANYKPDFSPYFKTPFSKNLIKWSESSEEGISIGNGAMMRISPVGYLFNRKQDVIREAKLATIPSHNSSISIQSATTIALMIYYFRNGFLKDDVYKKLNIKLEYKPFLKFNTTCSETIGNCLYVIYNSESFEDAIKKILLLGGDTDTNAAIVGSVAEALYGVPEYLKKEAENKLPEEFVRVLKKSKEVI